MENFENVDKLNKVLNGASQSTDNLLDCYIEMFDVLQISGATADLGLLLSMLLLKAGQLSKDTLYDRDFLEIADERLVDKIKYYAEECKTLTLEKDLLVKSKESINRKVYGKFSMDKPMRDARDKKGERTNADVVIDKVNKELKNSNADRFRSPRYH